MQTADSSPEPSGTGDSISQLEERLAAVQAETVELQRMLHDLPQILEQKFRQHLQHLWAEQQLLIATNQQLLQQVEQRRLSAGDTGDPRDQP